MNRNIGAVCVSCLLLWSTGRDSSAMPQDLRDRVLRKEVVVAASPAEAWHAWTTPDGIKSFFAPGCDIELKPGGKYEIYFAPGAPPGSRGAEGCRVLSVIPMEMLAFDWSAPPAVPKLREAGVRTQVVLRFTELDGRKVRVQLAQLGFGQGDDWEKYYAYFDRAWGHVLESLKQRFDAGGTRAVAEHPKTEKKTWVDGHVTVTSITAPRKRQDFELTLPLPAEEVWRVLATTEGFRKYLAPQAEIDLKPGGSYAVWPGATNRVLAFVPNEMLSTSGSAPPQFPNVRKDGTWSAYFFEPAGEHRTTLRLCVVGWQTGDEWDRAFDYFLKNNPVFLNSLHEKLAATQAQAPSTIVYEVAVDAPVADVWNAFTTSQGAESWMVAHAEIDLRVGGKMLTHYDPQGTLGDPKTIENTILAFDPMRMITLKVTRPPAGFPFPDAIKSMWTVVYFEPLDGDRTRVTCRGLGFGADEDSRKLREHFDKGNAWTLEKLREKFAR